MPEIATMGALERSLTRCDALYGILFRDINMKRTLCDQFFSRVINGFAGVIINTGEDNYLTTKADAIEEAHTVLASQFINEQFALVAGLPEEQMGLGHLAMNPGVENGFLYELAQAQMAREFFLRHHLVPPTKFMTGNIFKGHIQRSLCLIWLL